jgi:PTS system galactitol-specific IIA component
MCHNYARERDKHVRFKGIGLTMNEDLRDAALTPLVDPAICIRYLDASDDVSALSALTDAAELAGFVVPTFRAALLERERNYPTGLPTAIPVAIPHADVEHVLTPAIGVALLNNPVEFGEMGGSGSAVDARVVVLLLVTQPHGQVDLLVRLLGIFQTEGWHAKLTATRDATELAAAFSVLLAE